MALALEMDLHGYGDTWEEALDELRDLVLMQIGFAHCKGQPEMIWKDAEQQYWERFREVQREGPLQFHAGGLAVPPPHVIAAQRNRFALADG